MVLERVLSVKRFDRTDQVATERSSSLSNQVNNLARRQWLAG